MLWGVYGLWALPLKNNVSKIVHKLTDLGVESREFSYKSFTVFTTYFTNRLNNTCNSLLKQLKDGDSIVAHSFGGLLTIDLLKKNNRRKTPIKLKNLYLFNPAVDSDIKINSKNFEKMYIFHNSKDRLLRMAKAVPFNDLGGLGIYGYRYKDDKIVNIEIDPLENNSDLTHHHSAMIEPNLTKYSEFIKGQESV